ncbi:Uncharacterised protein [Shigella sonnei]|nr:hypothetical protein QMY51_02430 [Escherichia coli]CSO10440.1 Uncharacterised protein [Shigella sonnei]CAD5955989.1 unnamed protein product [Escherichia coli]CAD6011458.1 Uncharacterised protein [Escherichia coli]SRJ25731.1 Uncharacterised protein [Shigella sonnei]
MGRGLENAERRTSLSAEAISKTKPRLGEQSGVFSFHVKGEIVISEYGENPRGKV